MSRTKGQPTTKTEWDSAAFLDCYGTTWTPNAGANENHPIMCVNWYQSAAFCIWDEGFLPSEAEWNYAAAHGNEQRTYPWSRPPSSTTITTAHAVYSPAGATENVGSKSPTGDGYYGQADLAGNVWEWVLDFWKRPASC